MRKILHIDMDAFYASVEQRDRPDLRGKPVIVAWSAEPRSVVVAASYEARKYGVHSAMPATRAQRLCRDAIFVRPDFPRYKLVTEQIRTIFERHTPLVEFVSLDEAYLDVTKELTGIATATETANVIRDEIRDETRLTASAGVAPNKFLAKIASDWKKPDGLYVIRPHQIAAFLPPLAVGKIPGVGRTTEGRLHELSIETVGDLQRIAREELVDIFGKFGHRLWELARGIDESPVVPDRKAKSISIENTFQSDIGPAQVAEFLRDQAPVLWGHVVRKERKGRTITVKLRASDFTTATRRKTLPDVSGPEQLTAAALELLERFDFPAGTVFRLVGLGMSNFLEDDDQTPVRETEPRLF
ncbi:MAG TPA: DNA polymerase IV [Thermoanaerobaculia bacterium]|nr:DNA polymerase IV [Thermoanaerobaculia bacterium]